MIYNKKALFLYHVSFSIVGVKEGSILSKVDSINQECPIEIALNLLSGKWRLKILYYLLKGESIHFNQLQRLLGDITTKVLTAQLRTLEEAGIVSRVVYDESPIRVKYSMTDTGKTLIPLMTELCNWEKTYKKSRL